MSGEIAVEKQVEILNLFLKGENKIIQEVASDGLCLLRSLGICFEQLGEILTPC